MNPLFSVIVPIYNVEKYLKKCVDSILNQAYEDYELILVDDGSPDGCPQMCDDYARRDRKVKVVHKENGGLVSARKAGCQAATGRYILNVDADDWVAEGYFSAIEAVVLAHHPDVVCFGFIYQWADDSETITLPYETGLYSKKDLQAKLYPDLIESPVGEIFTPSVWSKAIERKLYVESQMRVDDRISIGEDSACTKPAIYRADSLYILDDHLYCYRQNNSSMTKNKKAFSLTAPRLISESYEKAVADDDAMQMQINRNFVHNFFIAAASQYSRTDGIRRINADIGRCLDERSAQRMIARCRYARSYWRGNLIRFSLKYRQYWLMRFYGKHFQLGLTPEKVRRS